MPRRGAPGGALNAGGETGRAGDPEEKEQKQKNQSRGGNRGESWLTQLHLDSEHLPGTRCTYLRPGESSWDQCTYLGPGGHKPLQLPVLVAALEQTGLVGPGLGLRGADSVGQQLRPGRGVGALTGHGPLPPPLPAGSRALHGRSGVSSHEEWGRPCWGARCCPPRPRETPAPPCRRGPATPCQPCPVTSAQGPVLHAGGQL